MGFGTGTYKTKRFLGLLGIWLRSQAEGSGASPLPNEDAYFSSPRPRPIDAQSCSSRSQSVQICVRTKPPSPSVEATPKLKPAVGTVCGAHCAPFAGYWRVCSCFGLLAALATSNNQTAFMVPGGLSLC